MHQFHVLLRICCIHKEFITLLAVGVYPLSMHLVLVSVQGDLSGEGLVAVTTHMATWGEGDNHEFPGNLEAREG